MHSKIFRGIQQEDVQVAADALIAEGLRPTIERVRQKIGRGSPNTVSPMLDNWFAGLSKRLGVANASDEQRLQPPEPVQAAAAMLWQAAMQLAKHAAQEEFLQENQKLDMRRAELQNHEAELISRQEAFNARQIALDETLQLARDQLTAMTSRLEEAGILQARRDREIEELRQQLKSREDERDAELQRRNDDATRHADERLRLEARATANEHRWLTELDRERLEVKRVVSAHIELESRAQATQTQLKTAQAALLDRLNQAERSLKDEHHAHELAKMHILELQSSLDVCRLAYAEIIKSQASQEPKNSRRKPLKQLMRGVTVRRKL
ncbi:MAG: DNA-binding protein [Polaromonas sp.]